MTLLRAPKGPGRCLLVSEAARRCSLTPRAIRFYEERGLVKSSRGPAGHRQFDEATLERLNFIGRARQLGLPLRDVKALLEIGDRHGAEARHDSLSKTCERLLVEIDQRRREVEDALRALTTPGPQALLRAAG